MHRRTLLIALTVAAVAVTLGYGLLGLAAPGGTATEELATASIDPDALAALASPGNARVIVVEESPTAPTPAWSDEDDDDRYEEHDDEDEDEDDDEDDDHRRSDRDDDD